MWVLDAVFPCPCSFSLFFLRIMEGSGDTHNSQLLVVGSHGAPVARVRPPAAQDLRPALGPPLGGRLAEVDLLALVSPREGV